MVSPLHSLRFYQALLAAGVQAELHVFGYGGHGLGLAPGDPDFAQWPLLLARWLRRSGFYSAAPRFAVSGTVSVDGGPVGIGWITFLPENANAPIVRAYMDGRSKGKFETTARHGALPGRHRVEVWRLMSRWPLDRSGAFSQEAAQRFTRLHPDDGHDIVLDLQPGGAEVDIALASR